MDIAKTAGRFRNAATLSLVLAEEQMARLFLLLQNGFFVEARVGCTIENFFLEQLRLSPDYIQARIQGIFLDGKPADHIDTAIIRDGARLTLSGTMPGLAGMALRRGPLAVFRHGITHRETGDYNYTGEGFVELKLLNLLMKGMGPGLFSRGIYVQSSDLAEYLRTLPPEFWQDCKTIALDGRHISPAVMQNGEWLGDERMVKFSVTPA